MTCKQLGGACDKTFHAMSFKEMTGLNKEHGLEMYHKGDVEHIKALKEMAKLMNDRGAMMEWLENKKKEFYSLQDD